MADSVVERLGGLVPQRVEATLRDATDAAARITAPLFRTALTVDNKWNRGFDPVTEADRRAEAAIRTTIAAAFPEHAIVGEEYGSTGSSRFTWVIDPIDGTRSFIAGVPTWGTLLGLMVDGEAVAGVMSQPFSGETFLALPGQAHYLRFPMRERLRTSGRTLPGEARLTTTTPQLFDAAGLRPRYDALEARCLQVRYGLDCYGFALLAAGHIDVAVEAGLQPYDIVALIPILREAGGAVARLDGGAPEAGGHIVAAATPQLLEAVLEVMAD